MSTSQRGRDILTQANVRFQAATGFSLIHTAVALFETGSAAYGTSTPDSNSDYVAIVIPPINYHLGLNTFEHWEPGVDPLTRLDLKAMSLKKFIALAAAGNPNTLEMLFFEPENVLLSTPYFDPFIEQRRAFISRQTYKRFAGYAAGQVKKMAADVTNRKMGAERKELVIKYGYDPKDASHLIRLQYAGRELVQTGTLTPRLDGMHKDIVCDIKGGLWKLAQIKELSFHLECVNELLFRSTECNLPITANMGFIEQKLIESQLTFIKDPYTYGNTY